MASFCNQCTRELFGFDNENNDFKGSITREQFFNEDLVAIGLCEGCSGGQFDFDGNCLGNCLDPTHHSSYLKDGD
jgi:hypothetical protein